MAVILVVDDDSDLTRALSDYLQSKGHDALTAPSGEQAFETIKNNPVDVMLLDLRLGDMGGLDLLEKVRTEDPDVSVVILTGDTGVPTAVKAIKLGAFDYLTKPCRNDEISLVVEQALKEKDLQKEVQVLRQRLTREIPSDHVIAQSLAMQRVLEEVSRIALTDLTVILQGESGTGKEVIARRIHHLSHRRSEDFIAVDCGALPESLVESELFGHEKGAFTGAHQRKLGLFELALGGTLFLDEIANLPLSTQAKLLRALQERRLRRIGGHKDVPFNARILAASNADLKEAVSKGKFREDLYHRLNQFSIHLPPLRERMEDIPLLSRHFLKEANGTLKKQVRDISEQAMEALENHVWRGNIRELKNVITRAVILTDDSIGLEHLGPEFPAKSSAKMPQRKRASFKDVVRTTASQEEKRLILEALKKARGNKTQAAKFLGINRMTLYLKLKKHNIPAPGV